MDTLASESTRQASSIHSSRSSSRSSDDDDVDVEAHEQPSSCTTAPATTTTTTSTTVTRAAAAAAARHRSFHTLLLCPLQNLGNTCYFNAGVQILANCPAFVYGLQHSPFLLLPSPQQQHSMSSRVRVHSGHTLCLALARLLHDMEDYCPIAPGAALAPVPALNALRTVHGAFEGWAQQDCMEMLNAVLGAIEDHGHVTVDVATLLRSFARDHAALAAARRRGKDSHATTTALKAHAMTRNGHSATDAAATRTHAARAGDDVSASSSSSSWSACATVGSAATTTTPLVHAAAAAIMQQQQQQNGGSATHKDDNNSSSSKATTSDYGVGTRSAHVFAALHTMRSVDEDNAALQACVTARKRAAAAQAQAQQSPPHASTSSSAFCPPQLHYDAATDAFKGYTMSHIRCHHCQRVSRVVEAFSSLMLDIPTHRQRAEYARRHPHVQRVGPDGQPLQHKRRSDVTWWNPLSYVLALCHRLCDSAYFFSGVRYPLTLQECLDIHFDAIALRGNNRYHCESCGCVSEATKSTTLLGLPEYLLLHMKRFRAGQLFHTKKTDSVLFPVAWTPLRRTAALTVTPPTTCAAVPEVLDLAAYVDACVAPYLAHAPAHVVQPQQQQQHDDGNAGNNNRHASDDNVEMRTVQPPSQHSEPTAAATAEAVAALDAYAARIAADTLQNNSNIGKQQQQQHDDDERTTLSPSRHLVSTYSLEGVVNHHGVSLGGGHYTAFVHKRTSSDDDDDDADDESNNNNNNNNNNNTASTSQQGVWVYMSDHELMRASASDVADSEEYVLLYRKQRLVEPDEQARQLRNMARYYLLAAEQQARARAGDGRRRLPRAAAVDDGDGDGKDDDDDDDTVYISRLWLQRMAYYTDPGPILNELCYCRGQQHDDDGSSSSSSRERAADARVHVHSSCADVAAYYVRIRRADYDAFHAAYGGNVALTHAVYTQLQRAQAQQR